MPSEKSTTWMAEYSTAILDIGYVNSIEMLRKLMTACLHRKRPFAKISSHCAMNYRSVAFLYIRADNFILGMLAWYWIDNPLWLDN